MESLARLLEGRDRRGPLLRLNGHGNRHAQACCPRHDGGQQRPPQRGRICPPGAYGRRLEKAFVHVDHVARRDEVQRIGTELRHLAVHQAGDRDRVLLSPEPDPARPPPPPHPPPPAHAPVPPAPPRPPPPPPRPAPPAPPPPPPPPPHPRTPPTP